MCSVSDMKNVFKNTYTYLLILILLCLHAESMFSQIALRELGCGIAIVEFSNIDQAEKQVQLYTESADDTIVFREDFSRLPHAQSGGLICNSMIQLRLPDSYTLYPKCTAKRIYSPNGDTCFFQIDGEFSTPLLDLSPYSDTIRISFKLKTESNYSSIFSLNSVSPNGTQTLLKQISIPKNTTMLFDSVLVLNQDSVRFNLSANGFVAIDDLIITSQPESRTICQTIVTNADTCVFTSLSASTKYYCTVSGLEETLSFTTPKALQLGGMSNLSPYQVYLTSYFCDGITNPRYVLKRLSDQTTIYATDLFISQVASTNTYNRAIEIYNGTGRDICLQPYTIVTDIHTGAGNYTTTNVLSFSESDTIKSDSCIVVMQALQAMTENSNGAFYVNPAIFGAVVIDGNDPIALIKDNDTLDIFGNFSESVNNTQAWATESMRTAKTVLQRQSWVSKGVNTNPQQGFPTLETEWVQLGNLSSTSAENFADFGSHTMNGALSGQCLDSVELVLESAVSELKLDNLEASTTYEIYLLAEFSGKTVKSETLRFKTGKLTQRTESGHWFDGNWTNGIPDSMDEAVVYNPQTLIIPENTQAKCYRLLIKDTLGADKARIYNNGNLFCKDAVYTDVNLVKNEQDSVSYYLFGIPLVTEILSRDSLIAFFNSYPNVELFESPQDDNFALTQSYLLKVRENTTLTLKGTLHNATNYDLISENSFGLQDLQYQTLLSYNPYSFSISVNQLLRENVSLPQRLNPQTGVFEPISLSDSLQNYEGFLVEQILPNSELLLTSTALSPIPEEENDILIITLGNGEKSDKAIVKFSDNAVESFNVLTDNHKFSLNENMMLISYLKDSESFSKKTLPQFEDSISLDFELNIPKLGVYSIRLDKQFAEECYVIALSDKESGVFLFDFMQDSIYTFQSSQGTKHFCLKIYKTLCGIDELYSKNDISLSQNGKEVRIKTNNKIEKISLFDMYGRCLNVIYGNQVVILPNKGAFLLNIKTDKGNRNYKVLNLE